MNLKATLRRRGAEGRDLQMTPIMNIFLILVPFLLLTASFVKIAILEMSLPSLSKQTAATSSASPQEPQKQLVLNIVAIRVNGFELKSPTFNFPFVARKGDQYDYERLKANLRQIKAKFPDSQDVVIAPDDGIKYDVIIQVMDRCRESGFPNLSISG